VLELENFNSSKGKGKSFTKLQFSPVVSTGGPYRVSVLTSKVVTLLR
jgi:hypothetical protein